MNRISLPNIRCYLLDMDGTIFLDDHLLPGAKDFVAYLQAQGIAYYFLTNNSSRSRNDYAMKLNRMGLAVEEKQIFTSGEATAIYLKQHFPGAAIYVVGTPSLEEEFRMHGLNLVQEGPDCVVLGFDTTLTYEKMWKLCDYVRAGKPYIATHPDTNCPTASGFMPDIGAMMAMVAASTGRYADVVMGKPNATMVEAIVAKTGLRVDELAMVGDRLYTDIAMGQSGVTTILVFSGETQPEDLAGSPFKPDYQFNGVQDLLNTLRSS